MGPKPDRRTFLGLGAAGAWGVLTAEQAGALQVQAARGKPTQFRVACMTLPYSQFPIEEAITSIKPPGYQFAAWCNPQRKGGHDKPVPVLPADAPPEKAKELGKLCRELGLEPVMMFSGVSPDSANGVDVLKKRVL